MTRKWDRLRGNLEKNHRDERKWTGWHQERMVSHDTHEDWANCFDIFHKHFNLLASTNIWKAYKFPSLMDAKNLFRRKKNHPHLITHTHTHTALRTHITRHIKIIYLPFCLYICKIFQHFFLCHSFSLSFSLSHTDEAAWSFLVWEMYIIFIAIFSQRSDKDYERFSASRV